MFKVKKRNGKIVEYDDSKIFKAIQLANRNSKDKRMTIAQITDIVGQVEDAFKEVKVPNVEKISDVTENILMKSKYVNTAKSYIIHRSEHKKRRDDIENIMDNFIDLTFKGDASVDSHRDNANIEAKSTMGAMLKYGTDISKYFVDNYVMPEEYVQAMNEGWVHFHDKDFSLLTWNCVVPESKLVIKENGRVIFTDFEYFNDYFTLSGQQEQEIVSIKNDNLYIASKDKKFTKIFNVMRRYHRGVINTILLDNGYSFKATDDHIVEIAREGKKMQITVAQLTMQDEFELTQYELFEHDKVHTAKVFSITKSAYDGYVYDFTTENHFFDCDGIIVHNCCQIDLEKLFKGGFSTGNGYIREPQSIRSYASLACIAIQSNQNKRLFVSCRNI